MNAAKTIIKHSKPILAQSKLCSLHSALRELAKITPKANALWGAALAFLYCPIAQEARKQDECVKIKHRIVVNAMFDLAKEYAEQAARYFLVVHQLYRLSANQAQDMRQHAIENAVRCGFVAAALSQAYHKIDNSKLGHKKAIIAFANDERLFYIRQEAKKQSDGEFMAWRPPDGPWAGYNLPGEYDSAA